MIRNYDALPAYLERRARTPFGWNGKSRKQQECFRFVMDGVRAQTRRDPIPAIRGAYRNKAEAEAIIAEHGSLRKLVRAHLSGIRPAFAKRGDVGMVKGSEGLTLGLIEGEHVVCLAGPEGSAGYVRISREALVAAWSAG